MNLTVEISVGTKTEQQSFTTETSCENWLFTILVCSCRVQVLLVLGETNKKLPKLLKMYNFCFNKDVIKGSSNYFVCSVPWS